MILVQRIWLQIFPLTACFAMVEKFRHFATWIAFAVSLLALIFNYFVYFHSILKNHMSFKNYLKKSFQWRWSHSSRLDLNSYGMENVKKNSLGILSNIAQTMDVCYLISEQLNWTLNGAYISRNSAI